MPGYDVPGGEARAEIEVRGSRFIAIANLAATPQEANAFLASVRDEFPDASHHVYAFRAGHGNSVTEGMSDDGEPSGTSGPPILSILRGEDLGDVIIVVVRYFGGTKLGTGGLVRAYSEATRSVLAALSIERKVEKMRLVIEAHYAHYDAITRLFSEAQGEVVSEEFTTEVLIELLLPVEQREALVTSILEVSAGQAIVIEADTR